MTRVILHRLRHPLHDVRRHGLAMSSFVCFNDDKEWLVGRFWQRMLAR